MNELPYIDTQTVTVRVPAAVVFETIERLVPRIAWGRFASAYARLVGAADLGVDHGPVGFHVVHSAATVNPEHVGTKEGEIRTHERRQGEGGT